MMYGRQSIKPHKETDPKINSKKQTSLVAVLVVFFVLLLTLVYTTNRIEVLEKKLSRIEIKLGGEAKLSCNEKESIEKVMNSVVRVVGGEGEGSGFAVENGKMILTNFHVIEFEPSPKVIFPDNTFETAEIILADKDTDLAVLKIETQIPPTNWGDSENLSPAEDLIAIGFPLGGELSGEASVIKGSLSGKRHLKEEDINYLQTNITFAGGESGGPMIDICGDVMGINTSGLTGMGFAISTNTIRDKWIGMENDKSSLDAIKKISFNDTESGEFAVATFYNYLKVRRLDKAFELLSDNFKRGYGFDHWKRGYESLLDTTIIKAEDDEQIENRVNIKLSTKDFVDEEIVTKYFEGFWEVRNIDGRWKLWEAEIKEIEPDYFWFYE